MAARLAVILTLFVSLASGAAHAQGAAGVRVLHAWEFRAPADLAGWSYGDTGPLEYRDGTLVTRTGGKDPLLTAPNCRVTASPSQVVVIEMRSSAAGTAQLFWTGTTEGPFGGFAGEKRTDFPVIGDGQFHEYRLSPFWHAEKQILRLRLDPPENSDIALRAIRILEPPAPPLSSATAWQPGAQWRPGRIGKEAVLLSPSLDFAAEERSWVACSLSAKTAGTGRLYWAAAETNGVHSLAFPIRAGNSLCNVDAAGAAAWRGHIVVLGLSLPAGVQVGRLSLAAEPQGPAAPEVASLDLRDAVNRAGRPAVLLAIVRNSGGATAQGVRARVKLGPGVALDAGEKAEKPIAALEYGETAQLTWRVRAAKPGQYPVSLALLLPRAAPRASRVRLTFTALPAGARRASYVPEPRPVASAYDVGVYYFPGWNTYSRWSVLNDFPERRPVLGYYREGSPEVADWQIKWASEHGVKFFIYDWYWSQGARHLEHGLHDAYFNAHYRGKLKFCLLWANHNPAHTSSEADLLKVTDYWLANYFKRPEYYTVNGRPMMVIFSPSRFTSDMGVEAVKQAFVKMRERVRAAGFPDLFLVACTGPDEGTLRTLKEEGYDAASGYNYPAAGAPNDLRAPYASAVGGYEQIWNQIAGTGLIDTIPVTDPGWDSRPWHGDAARVRTGRTPALFRDMLVRARAFVDKHTPAGRPKIVFVEAWNEFGEGAAVEPHREWGFAKLDAIRSVFTQAPAAHTDLAPGDVGLGPYDLAPDPLRTAWDFKATGEALGWASGQNLREIGVHDGALWGTAVNHDPAFFSPTLHVSAARYPVVEVRMKSDRGEAAQLFWATSRTAESEANSVSFPITADNQFHTYRLEVGKSVRWRGTITRLRLDPNANEGSVTAIESVRLLEK